VIGIVPANRAPSYRAPMGPASDRAARIGVGVILLGVLAWLTLAVASAVVPSPARETRFVEARGRLVLDRVYCHGMVAIDRDLVWSVCQRDGARSRNYLARFDAHAGTTTLLGPIRTDASGLGGGVVGPDGERIFLVGNLLLDVRGDAVRTLGDTHSTLGLARAGNGVEVVDRFGSDLRVTRYENGHVAARRPWPRAVPASAEHHAQAEAAYFDGASWHVLVADHPRVARMLPLSVGVRDQTERGATRLLGVVRLSAETATRGDDGSVSVVPGWLLAGTIVSGSSIAKEYVRFDGSRFERIRFAGDPFVEVAATVLGVEPHARALITEIAQRRFVVTGETTTRVERRLVRSRFDALRAAGRDGPPLVASFWMDPGFRLIPRERGGYLLLGALGGGYVTVGRDLARDDALSFAERLARLFVEDRAKHNSDFFHGASVLRVATVPWSLAGPLVGALVLGLRRRRARAASALGATWIAFALLGAWHFAYVLRYFW